MQVDVWVDGENRVEMSGVIREKEGADWLQPLLNDVHAIAMSRKMSEVVLDIKKVEYANANLWKCLVLWIKRMREDPESTYRLRLVASSIHAWQRAGVPMLRIFGGDRLVVEGFADTE